uniref:DAGKc domain-containing protein n=3 Tax=Parascaris univalens TaxID=6257 RepID=A0A915AE40_PARUN
PCTHLIIYLLFLETSSIANKVMGVLSSKVITFYDWPPEEGSKNFDSQIVNVMVNGQKFQSVECILSGNALQFRVMVDKYFKVLFDDIISISIITTKVNSGICGDAAELYLLVFPLANRKRVSLSLNVTFHDANVAEHWRKVIKKFIEAPLAPHFPIATLRMRRKILVIVNPFSGQKKALKMWKDETEPIFIAAQLDYEVVLTERVGHATEIARNVCLNDYDGIAIVSGDGLVLEVIEGFLMRADRIRALKMPIAHIPGGTSNGLAAAVCFQCNEPFAPRGVFCLEAALMVARPRYLPLRICHVQTERDGDKAMFLSATWGLVADIDIGSERFRWAGMVRLHIEAFIRIAQLPTVAHYKARISYLPVSDKQLKRATRLRHISDRKKFGKNHFKYDEVENIDEKFAIGDAAEEINEALLDTDLIKNNRMPSLSESLSEDDWVTVEGEFVYACAVNISHLGSDLPYLPSSRLDDPILYLTLLDWKTVESRLQVARMMITIDGSHHLAYPCLQIIPVRACRIEPLEGCGGYIAIDGEPITPGTAFQVVPSKYCATVIGRNERVI